MFLALLFGLSRICDLFCLVVLAFVVGPSYLINGVFLCGRGAAFRRFLYAFGWSGGNFSPALGVVLASLWDLGCFNF